MCTVTKTKRRGINTNYGIKHHEVTSVLKSVLKKRASECGRRSGSVLHSPTVLLVCFVQCSPLVDYQSKQRLSLQRACPDESADGVTYVRMWVKSSCIGSPCCSCRRRWSATSPAAPQAPTRCGPTSTSSPSRPPKTSRFRRRSSSR
jgi:hypothetical protein